MTTIPSPSQQSGLADLRSQLRVFIADLARDRRDPFGVKLRQIVAAHQREIDRKLNHGTGTKGYLERLVTYHLATILLFQRHVDHLASQRSQGIRWTKDERRITKHIQAALTAFTDGINELSKQFGPQLWHPARLPAMLWLVFSDMSTEEAERDAAEIVTMLDAAQEQHQ